MIYTKERMAAIRAGIQKAGLSAPQEFFDAGIDELCEICNGVGGAELSNDSRLKLTRAFSFIEYSAAVHDWRYAKSDGTEEKRLEADKEFRANMLDEILYRAPSWKWWKELKALGTYSLVRKLGRAAWCIAFAESATKQAESAEETGAQNG